MSSPWDRQKVTSPATRFIKSTIDRHAFWLNELRKIGPSLDEADAIHYWNLLSAIYALTEEEKLNLRATDAYSFSGGSATTGKRKLMALIGARLVLTAKNPGRRNEKLLFVSEEAGSAVLRTLDQWASCFQANTAAYLSYRSSHRSQPVRQ